MMARLVFAVIGIVLMRPASSASMFVPPDSLTPVVQMGSLRLTSNVAGAKVYLDSICIGEAPCELMSIGSGVHLVTVTHPDEHNWFHPSVTETLVVRPGEHLERLVKLAFVYNISSSPDDATIRRGDSVLGQTPLLYSTTSTDHELTLMKDGYERESLMFPDASGPVHVVLRPLPGEDRPALSALVAGGRSKNLMPVYYTLGGTVVAGVAAAYFKIKADSYHRDYQATGDPGALDRVRRFDTIAGIALVTSELGVLFLSYLLLSH